MVSYGLDDLLDPSSGEEEGDESSLIASPLAGRVVVRPPRPRVSFANISPDSSSLASPTRPLPLDVDSDDFLDESDEDESFQAAAPRRRNEREYSVDDAVDSEEEEWPVDPPRPRSFLSRLEVQASDPWSIADEAVRAKSWSAVNLAFSRNLKDLHARQAEVVEAARLRRLAELEAEEAEISALVQSLSLEQDRAAEQAARDFEERNQQLWAAINATIAATEKLAAQQAAEAEAERKAQEAAAQAAEEARLEAKRKAEEVKRKAEERLAKEKAETARRKEEAEAAEQERLRVEEEAKVRAAAPASGPEAEYRKWMDKMRSIKNDVLPAVSQDADMRKACSAAKRQITPKVGMLVNTAESVTTITALLAKSLITLRQLSATAYTWGLNHLAKSLIRQAETEVTAKQSVAFPLGRVVVGLLLRGHGELGDVLMARLAKKCFWVTACYPRRTEGTSNEAHLKALGHTVAGESSVQYSERMAGIIALYAAIIQTSPIETPQAPSGLPAEQAVAGMPAHFQPDAGWSWLVHMLQPPLVGLEPVPNLLETFLAIAGAGLHEVFRKQFLKFLFCLWKEGIKGKQAGFSDKSRASQVKLELRVEDWISAKKVGDADGRTLEAPVRFDD